MSVLIMTITSAWNQVIALVVKISGFLMGMVGSLVATISKKFLSFQWVKSVYSFLEKIKNVLKNTIFNAKVVKICNILLSLTLFALTAAQTIFIAVVLIGMDDSVLPVGAENMTFFVINVASVVILIGFLIAFIVKLWKKKLSYGFLAAILYVYFLMLFSDRFTSQLIFRDLIRSFDTLKVAFIVIFSILAFLKLFDADHSINFSSFLFSALGVLFIYLLFESTWFANIASYDMHAESVLTSKDIDFLSYFRHVNEYFAETLRVDAFSPSKELLLQSLALMETTGKFVTSMAIILNGFVLFVSALAPYLLLSTLVGFVLSLLNRPPLQVAYLSKSLKAYKYLFFGLLFALISALILSCVYRDDAELLFQLNVSNILFSLLSVIGLVILCFVCRSVATNRYTNHLKKKS